MALTISNPQRFASNFRNEIVDIAFDSAYAFGGESFAAGKTALSKFYKVEIEPVGGYTFEYDYTNAKIKVFAPAPAIVFEEKHTASSNLITLDYPAAWIINVCQAGQHMAWGKSQAAATLAGNSFCVVGAMEDGVRTQLYTDGASDVVYVTYVTQAWAELYAQLVQEEAVTLATGANNLANKLLAFGFCEGASSGILLPVDIADATAAGEVGIKMGYATGALDIEATQNGEAAVVTYLAEPTSGFLTDRFVEDEDPAASGTYIHTFDFPLLMWCISGYLTVVGGTTQVIIDELTAPGAGEAHINWGYRGSVVTHQAPAAGHAWATASNVAVTAGAYLKGHPWEIPGLVNLEVKNGTDLSGLTGVKVHVFGR
ncbi:MAG: hypothetical protein ABIH23_20610 [bacterium]